MKFEKADQPSWPKNTKVNSSAWEADLATKPKLTDDADRVSAWSSRLGIPESVLGRLDFRIYDVETCYAYPKGYRSIIWNEYDGDGEACGQSYRHEDGTKAVMYLSVRGMFLPPGWSESDGTLFIAEGMSDTAALLAAGLNAIGRPSKCGQFGAALANLINRTKYSTVVVIADRDDAAGADRLAGVLATTLPGREVRWGASPDGSKDVREWLTTRTDDWADRRVAFFGALELRAPSPQKEDEPPTSAGEDNDDGSGEEGKKEAAVKVMLEIVNLLRFWHDGSTPYVTLAPVYTNAGSGVTYDVGSKEFSDYLSDEYIDFTGGKKVASEGMLTTAVRISRSKALKGEEHTAYVRVGKADGKVYLHLADKENQIVEVGPAGWRVCGPDDPVPRMVSRPHMKPLPVPVRGGRINDLQRYFNLPDRSRFSLVKAWIASCFVPDGPFPILVVSGEQGSAKSSLARGLKALLDPSEADSRKPPRDSRDLLVAATGGWVLNYDNLSGIREWLSDDLCRLSTGGGISTRTLYTDGDETVLRAKRPVIINGIGDIVGRADLLDRAVLVHLPRLPKKEPERQRAAAFHEALPSLLGAVLDYIAGGLQQLKNVEMDPSLRMADFVEMALACEMGEGCEPVFLDSYRANLCRGQEHVLETSPIVGPLLKLMKRRLWTGPASRLLDELEVFNPSLRPPKGWPGAPHILSSILSRLAPPLRDQYGIEIEWGSQGRDKAKIRTITITLNDAGLARVEAEEAAEKAGGERSKLEHGTPDRVASRLT